MLPLPLLHPSPPRPRPRQRPLRPRPHGPAIGILPPILLALVLALLAVLARPVPASADDPAPPSLAGPAAPARLAFSVRPPGEALDALSEVRDLAVGPDGTLYVADPGGCRVIRVAPDGRTLGAWGGCGHADGRFFVPSALAVAPDGRVAVADAGLGRIQIFDARGSWLRTIDARGIDCRQAHGVCPARPWDGLLGLTFDRSGDLHVIDMLQERRPSTLHVRTWARIGADGSVQAKEQLSWQPTSIKLASLTTTRRGTLMGLTNSGAIIRIVPGSGDEPMLTLSPRRVTSDLDVGPDDGIWAVAHREIVLHDPTGRVRRTWPVAETEGFTAVAVAPDGTVYAAATLIRASLLASVGQALASTPSAIWRLRPDALEEGPEPFWGRPTTSAASQAMSLRAVAAGGGRVHLLHNARYWVDATSGGGSLVLPPQVVTLDAAGQEIAQWGGRGLEPGSFAWLQRYSGGPKGPLDLAVGPDGDVHVADTEADRVQRFDRNGRLKGLSTRSDYGPLPLPIGVAVADDGTVAVLNDRLRIFRFGPDGEPFPTTLDTSDVPTLAGSPPEWHPLAMTRDGSAVDLVAWGYNNSNEYQFVVRRSLHDGAELARRRLPNFNVGMSPPSSMAIDPWSGPVVIVDGHILADASPDGWRAAIPVQQPPYQEYPMLSMDLDENGDAWVAGLAYRNIGPQSDQVPVIQRRLHRYTRVWPTTWRAELSADPHFGGRPLVVTMTEGLALAEAPAAILADGSADTPAEMSRDALTRAQSSAIADALAATSAVRFERVLSAADLAPPARPGDPDDPDDPPDPADPSSAALRAAGGTFRFHLRVAGGARLWVDDAIVVDDWDAPQVDVALDRFLSATWGHRIVVEARTAPVEGAVALDISPIGGAHRIHIPIAHGAGRLADAPPPPPTPTPLPGYPGPSGP